MQALSMIQLSTTDQTHYKGSQKDYYHPHNINPISSDGEGGGHGK
jgi:hypothetical protein